MLRSHPTAPPTQKETHSQQSKHILYSIYHQLIEKIIKLLILRRHKFF